MTTIARGVITSFSDGGVAAGAGVDLRDKAACSQMQESNAEHLREAFEEWWYPKDDDYRKTIFERREGLYLLMGTHQSWETWKAARTFTQEDVENARYAISQSDDHADCEDKAKAALSAIGEVK